MTKLAVFSFGNHEIRTITDEHGEAWFVANDVCEALELGNARQALSLTSMPMTSRSWTSPTTWAASS